MCRNYITYVTEDECKCTAGRADNGGKALNASGYCEFFCSKPFGGVKYCGLGQDYQMAGSIDCRKGNIYYMYY